MYTIQRELRLIVLLVPIQLLPIIIKGYHPKRFMFFWNEPYKRKKSRRAFPRSHFMKNEAKLTHFVSGVSHSARGSAFESICTLQASKVFASGQHWAQRTVFLSQWFHPHGLSSLLTLKKQTAVLSCPLSATKAVMKMGRAVRGSRGRKPSLQSLNVHSSVRLAGLPLGHLLENER